jgi:ribonuclease J
VAKAKLRAVPLGGLEEIGKNMTAFEYGDDIVVVDCGLMFPDESMLGIDLVIPDITYLEENKARVRAIVITHGHEDHTGALPYVLARLPVPVYATRLTRGLIELKLREHKLLDKIELITIKAGGQVPFGEMTFEFFHQCHSIPDAVGVAIHTPVGIVVHTGDYKFDQTPVDGEPPDYARLAQLGQEGVLALFGDSTRADTPGSTPSERVIDSAFKRVFDEAKGRVIVASFASLISRIQQVVDAAAAHNRKFAVVGRSMVNNVGMGIELGYLKVPDGVLMRIEDALKLPDDQICIMTTGSQGEPSSALTRMANGDQRHVTIKAGDTVVISATPIPGNEEHVGRNVDNLFKLGAHVVYERYEQIHVSGHGAQDELKLMISLLRPRFLVPVHGQYRHLVAHKRLGEQMGIPSDHIILAENGLPIEFTATTATLGSRVPAGYVFVDGASVGDVGDVVLRDRQLLAQDGILMVALTVDRQTGKFIAGPDIVSRGFVHMRSSDELIERARAVVYDTLGDSNGDGTAGAPPYSGAKGRIRDALGRFLYEETRRRPMIMPVLLEA